MTIDHFDLSHASEVTRLCNVIVSNANGALEHDDKERRRGRVVTIQNAALRIREIAERFSGDEKGDDDEHE